MQEYSNTRPLYYTKQGLADVCGVNIDTITRHTKLNTLRLQQARERIPGMGIRYKAGLCERFVAAMRAKHAKGGEAPPNHLLRPAAFQFAPSTSTSGQIRCG